LASNGHISATTKAIYSPIMAVSRLFHGLRRRERAEKVSL